MKNLKKKISALVLTTMFASMQVSYANGLADASFNKADGGFVNMVNGDNSATLNFNGDSHVNWNTLNVGKNESLNFNAVNGASGLTILNTVNQGMTNIYGQVNANAGISKLIISNPNGVLFDGAKFTTAGDAMITTQAMTANFVDGKMVLSNVAGTVPAGVVTIQDSDISAGGEFNILAPTINVVGGEGTIKTGTGFRLVTENGQDYVADSDLKSSVRMESVNIDGDVYIVNKKGVVKTVGGGEINGNLNIQSDDSVSLNYVANGKALHVTGDVDVEGNGVLMYARNAKVDGNLNMQNGGGFLEVGNVKVGKDMNLKTVAKSENKYGYKHFVHVIGNSEVGGNVNVESKDNIHIGNYNFEEKKLLDGSLKVGGDLTAHAQDGHVMVTIDTSAKNIDLKSDNLNVLTDGKATLTADTYKFSSKGYIGGLNGFTKDGKTYTTDEVIIDVMEGYKYIPDTKEYANANVNIAGGEIKMIETPTTANILSKGDVKLTGADAKTINITAPEKYMEITGKDVHANEINVGNETKTLKVDFPSRDYTLNYTNIRDGKKVTVNKDEVITYELTNAPKGYNDGNQVVGETTYLVGPEKPVDPEPTPEPTPAPQPNINPDDNENAKILRSYENRSIDLSQVHTPVAYAADLDDDQNDTGVRKNVDGSVTVVRAFPMD